jgi:DNA repair exonuclease SbcCD ATPase subunit
VPTGCLACSTSPQDAFAVFARPSLSPSDRRSSPSSLGALLDRTDPPSSTTSGREELAAVVKAASASKRRRRANKKRDAISKNAKLSNAEQKLQSLQENRKVLLGKLSSALTWQSTAKKTIARLQAELDAATAEVEKQRLSAAADRAAHALDLRGRIDQNTELLNEAHRNQKEHINRLQHENRIEKAELKNKLARALGAEKHYRNQRDDLRREKEQAAALIASLQHQLQRATFPACLP